MIIYPCWDLSYYPTLAREFQGLGYEESLYFVHWNSRPHPPINPSGQSRLRSWPITQCPIAPTRESTPKQWAVIAIAEDKLLTFETDLIKWLYLLFKCGLKTKTHFEWVLWYWSSLCQLNLEPTWPNGLVGCKVLTDLEKISIKEAMHVGFYYKPC